MCAMDARCANCSADSWNLGSGFPTCTSCGYVCKSPVMESAYDDAERLWVPEEKECPHAIHIDILCDRLSLSDGVKESARQYCTKYIKHFCGGDEVICVYLALMNTHPRTIEELAYFSPWPIYEPSRLYSRLAQVYDGPIKISKSKDVCKRLGLSEDHVCNTYTGMLAEYLIANGVSREECKFQLGIVPHGPKESMKEYTKVDHKVHLESVNFKGVHKCDISSFPPDWKREGERFKATTSDTPVSIYKDGIRLYATGKAVVQSGQREPNAPMCTQLTMTSIKAHVNFADRGTIGAVEDHLRSLGIVDWVNVGNRFLKGRGWTMRRKTMQLSAKSWDALVEVVHSFEKRGFVFADKANVYKPRKSASRRGRRAP